MANNHDVIGLTLHGGGQGFESPRLHSRNAPEKVLLVLGYRGTKVNWLRLLLLLVFS